MKCKGCGWAVQVGAISRVSDFPLSPFISVSLSVHR